MPDIRRLFWEQQNEEHVARHEVARDEVEEVCHGAFIAGQAYGGRLMLIGPTQAGRLGKGLASLCWNRKTEAG